MPKQGDVTVWEAMNEPIAYPDEKFINHFFSAAGLIVLMLWLMPFMGTAGDSRQHIVDSMGLQITGHGYVSVFEEMEQMDVSRFMTASQVAGAKTIAGNAQQSTDYGLRSTESALYSHGSAVLGAFATATEEVIQPKGLVPDIAWRATVNEFGIAANDVLDISDQAAPYVEFFQPGVSAVWEAWLELVKDPVIHE